jgi:hypothetical protein
MEIGFELKIIYKDAHLLKVRISAWNGKFGGEADVYVGLDRLQRAAEEIEGFPRNPADTREVLLGNAAKSAAPGVVMRFYCADMAGHAYIEARIESGKDDAGHVQSSTLFLPVEGGAIDSFVRELRCLASGESQLAHLSGVLPDR